MLVSQMLAGEFTPGTTGPSAAPINPSLYTFKGKFIGVQWTSGDTTAQTQIGYRADPFATLEPLSVTATVSPAVTGWESTFTKDEQVCTWWVRHIKDGQVTAWVAATTTLTCVEPE